MHTTPRQPLTIQEVRRLELLLGGDLQTQAAVVEFIRQEYGARTLLYLPRRVAEKIARHPAEFVQAAKALQHSLNTGEAPSPLVAFWSL